MASRSVLHRASKGHQAGRSTGMRSVEIQKVEAAARDSAARNGVDPSVVKVTGDEWGRWHVAAPRYNDTSLMFLGENRWVASFGAPMPTARERNVDTETAIIIAREMFDPKGRATGSIRGKLKARFHGRWTDDDGKSAPHLDGPLQLDPDSISVKVHTDIDVVPESVMEVIDAPEFEVIEESTGSASGKVSKFSRLRLTARHAIDHARLHPTKKNRAAAVKAALALAEYIDEHGVPKGAIGKARRAKGRAAGRVDGPWQPASGGTEPVFVARSGKRLQYMFQPSTGRHAYLDVDTDLILSDEEAMAHLEGKPGFGRR